MGHIACVAAQLWGSVVYSLEGIWVFNDVVMSRSQGV